MSVQSEINRIKGNVTASLAKIAEKGVTVPDGANSDNMAALIDAIEAGGGVITGTFTVESDTTKHNIDYFPQSVDEWPSWLIVIAQKDVSTIYSSFNGVWVIQIVYSNVSMINGYFHYDYSQTIYGYNSGNSKYYAPYFRSDNIQIAYQPTCNPSANASRFLAGVTYRYYMGIG